MCKGCEHEAACTALKLIDLSPEPSPCYEPAGFVSVLDAFRTKLPDMPIISIRYINPPVTEPVYN